MENGWNGPLIIDLHVKVVLSKSILVYERVRLPRVIEISGRRWWLYTGESLMVCGLFILFLNAFDRGTVGRNSTRVNHWKRKCLEMTDVCPNAFQEHKWKTLQNWKLPPGNETWQWIFPHLDDCPSYKPPLIAEDHQPYHRTGDHTPYTAFWTWHIWKLLEIASFSACSRWRARKAREKAEGLTGLGA